MAALPQRARALIDFWFGPDGDPGREQHRDIWFRSTPEHDDTLRRLFLGDYQQAAARELAGWEAEPLAALALLLLLDQIPRNIFRDTARAYVTDPMARHSADRALAAGFDRTVPTAWRKFFYMPFHHSEDLADQRRSVALWDSLREERNELRAHDRDSGANRRYGMPYLDVIERFGRFPHRNAILGRASTPEEIEFLQRARAARET